MNLLTNDAGLPINRFSGIAGRFIVGAFFFIATLGTSPAEGSCSGLVQLLTGPSDAAIAESVGLPRERITRKIYQRILMPWQNVSVDATLVALVSGGVSFFAGAPHELTSSLLLGGGGALFAQPMLGIKNSFFRPVLGICAAVLNFTQVDPLDFI